ncbi:hypothetical protein A7W90_05785 [Clostridium sp. Bc-iso-3]|uniref:Uncharacterized protein n=1 Tax=Desulfitobacterium dehalogenans TaxID=36854 RepID=A0A7C7D8Q2_9FIRM|nr:hypothetical protein A7W90_05785 [Clostridium sp. Bc-iso-3]HHY29034.1 hypothetical protein [Desulfitobacterium dehalogenans]
MKVFLTTPIKYHYPSGKWMLLPVPEIQLKNIIDELSYGTKITEYMITDYNADIVILHDAIDSYKKASQLNEVAKVIHNLSKHDEDILCALMECEYHANIDKVKDIIKQLPTWELLGGIDSDDALGKLFAEANKHNSSITDYSDFGKYIRSQHTCIYTSMGCLIHKNFLECFRLLGQEDLV